MEYGLKGNEPLVEPQFKGAAPNRLQPKLALGSHPIEQTHLQRELKDSKEQSYENFFNVWTHPT